MSINSIHRSLFAFWSSFVYTAPNGERKKLKAYLAGHVPDDAAFPYLTFDVARGEEFSSTYLTVFDWHKSDGTGRNVNAERADLMDAIAEAIPNSGILLEMSNGGYIELLRNSEDFQTYYDDPEDKTVIGGRTSYRVNFYC